MSLTRFIAIPEVKARIKPLRPKLSRKITEPLRIEPRSNHYMLVGTAFDYLLRFELQRRAPHAVAKKWVAESALDSILGETYAIVHGERDTATSAIWLRAVYETRAIASGEMDTGGTDFEEFAWEVDQRACKIMEDAKAAVAAYVKNRAPSPAEQAELAGHAIRLAQLDSVYRAGRLDPTFAEADPEDTQDLVDMLAIAPFNLLLHKKVMLLNPTFGESSGLVGGADADLITGDMLVDFKTTKRNEIEVGSLDQLLGYFLLARNQRGADPKFPKINKLGLYFCRHGYLWIQDTTVWTGHPQFPEIEEWFCKRAKEVFGSHEQKYLTDQKHLTYSREK